MLKEEMLQKVAKLDEEYFKRRSPGQLIRALTAQVHSMEKEPTTVNRRKQMGDALFVLVSMARNEGWDLGDLLEETIAKVERRQRERHYYEAHITIEPVFEAKLLEFKRICKIYEFHVATLLMQKRKKDTPSRSSNDSFCTGRSISYSDLEDRMLSIIRDLIAAGIRVWRYKIESTLLDSRYGDGILPLDRANLPEKELMPRAPAEGALAGRLE